MNDQELRQFYENAYQFELQQQMQINARISLPVALLTLLVGVLTFFMSHVDHADQSIALLFLYVILGLAAVSIAYAFYCIYRALFVGK